MNELALMNAFIGFCTPSGQYWPSILAEKGYRIVGVEKRINIDGTQPTQTVTPELVATSERLRHALLVEAKSATIDGDQCRRYQSVSSSDIFETGLFGNVKEKALATSDVVYACPEEFSSYNMEQMKREDVLLPLVACDEEQFKLCQGELTESEVHKLFKKGVSVKISEWPDRYATISRDTSFGDIAQEISLFVVSQLLDDSPFTVDDVARNANFAWEFYGDEEREQICERINWVLDEASYSELRFHLSWDQAARQYERHRLKNGKTWSPRSLAQLHVKARLFRERMADPRESSDLQSGLRRQRQSR